MLCQSHSLDSLPPTWYGGYTFFGIFSMATKHYDLLAIVGSQVAPEAADGVLGTIRDLVTAAGGEVLNSHVIGKRKLAYPIGKHKTGTYVDLDFNLEPAAFNGFTGKLKLVDEVIRFLPIQTKLKTAKELEEEARIQEKIQARKAREDAQARQTREAADRLAETATPKRTAVDAAPLSLDELDKKIDEILDEDAVK